MEKCVESLSGVVLYAAVRQLALELKSLLARGIAPGLLLCGWLHRACLFSLDETGHDSREQASPHRVEFHLEGFRRFFGMDRNLIRANDIATVKAIIDQVHRNTRRLAYEIKFPES